MAETLDFSADPEKLAAFQELDFAQMRTEVAEAERMGALCASPVRWCHNDLLSGASAYFWPYFLYTCAFWLSTMIIWVFNFVFWAQTVESFWGDCS